MLKKTALFLRDGFPNWYAQGITLVHARFCRVLCAFVANTFETQVTHVLQHMKMDSNAVWYFSDSAQDIF